MLPFKRLLAALGLGLCACLVGSCDLNPFDTGETAAPVFVSTPPASTTPPKKTPTFGVNTRRIYVNDSAASDSLGPALVNLKAGIHFVLQPYRNYSLRVNTTGKADQFNLYVALGSSIQFVGTWNNTVSNGAEYFNIHSNQSTSAVFAAVLSTPDSGSGVAKRIKRVRLLPDEPTLSSGVKVHLFVVGKFKSITDANRGTYAAQFLTELKAVYADFGVTLTTSYEIIDTAARVTLPFNGAFASLPGTRLAGNAHLYLVDSISYASTTLQILGFSPREVENLDFDPDSRVVLSSRIGSAISLASTASHELGHFFGLRHTTSTQADRNVDLDNSNIEDGLSSTSYCSDMLLSKVAAAPEMNTLGPNGKPYCLFTAGTPTTCPSDCNLTYLMHAYYCAGSNPAAQRVLTSEQKSILRQNLAVLQGL